MNAIVLDANVALDWCLPSPEGEAYSQPLAQLVFDTGLRFCVPEHFAVEVARILVIRGRNGKSPLGEKWLKAALLDLDNAPIDTFAMGINFQLLGDLSQAYGLDAPDVPYFHMAREMGIPIASRDKAIIKACGAWHVQHWKP